MACGTCGAQTAGPRCDLCGSAIDTAVPASAAAPSTDAPPPTPSSAGSWSQDPPAHLPPAPPAVAPGPVEQPAPAGGGRGPLPLVLGAALAVMVLAGVGWALTRGSDGDAAAPGPVVTKTVTTGASSQQPEEAATGQDSPAPMEISVPANGKICSEDEGGELPVVAVGDEVTTSCPFAEAVRDAYVRAAPPSATERTVTAHSPSTGQTYEMSCSGVRPVTCIGGRDNSAIVLLYGR